MKIYTISTETELISVQKLAGKKIEKNKWKNRQPLDQEHDENDFIQNTLSIPQKAIIKCEYVNSANKIVIRIMDHITRVIGKMTRLKN